MDGGSREGLTGMDSKDRKTSSASGWCSGGDDDCEEFEVKLRSVLQRSTVQDEEEVERWTTAKEDKEGERLLVGGEENGSRRSDGDWVMEGMVNVDCTILEG